jgi:hypothetical protein
MAGEENGLRRIGELDIRPNTDGSPSPTTLELDRVYGVGAWATREAVPNGTMQEGLYSNMGYAILEVYQLQQV